MATHMHSTAVFGARMRMVTYVAPLILRANEHHLRIRVLGLALRAAMSASAASSIRWFTLPLCLNPTENLIGIIPKFEPLGVGVINS